VRDVVATLTLNVWGTVALKVSLAGREQVALAGAPVQVREAVPLSPLPPMETE